MEVTAKNLLMTELTRRQTRNPSYSLRAFARDLNIGATTLSDVLSNKRSLSKINLHKVIERLAVSPLEQQKLWGDYKLKAQKQESDERIYLDETMFRLISDWHYIAILNLAKLKNNLASPLWIAQRLGITQSDATEALERLLELKLIKKQHGRMLRTAKPLGTTKDIPSAAIRKHHTQNLHLAEESLHRDPVHTREFGSITMAVNPERLPLVKDLLTKTRKKVADLLDHGATSEVYTLSFQLFPLTKLEILTEDKND